MGKCAERLKHEFFTLGEAKLLVHGKAISLGPIYDGGKIVNYKTHCEHQGVGNIDCTDYLIIVRSEKDGVTRGFSKRTALVYFDLYNANLLRFNAVLENGPKKVIF